MKRIIYFSVCLIFMIFSDVYAGELDFKYENNAIVAKFTSEPYSLVTLKLYGESGLKAIKQEHTDAYGEYCFNFTFEEEERGNYTFKLVCGDENYEKEVYYEGASGNSFLYFALLGVNGIINGDRIDVRLPSDTNLFVAPNFETDKYAIVTVNGENQRSNETKQDFSKDVKYVITSGQGEKRVYTVHVTRVPTSSNSGQSSGGSGGGSGGGSLSMPFADKLPSQNTPSFEPEKNEEIKMNFKDVETDYWGYSAIWNMYKTGVISDADKFEPERNITRSEFVKMIVLALNKYNPDAKCNFKDIISSSWAESYIASAVQANIVKGISEEEFGVNECITRQDAACIVGRAVGIAEENPEFDDNIDISQYAAGYIGGLQKIGKVVGREDNLFMPKQTMTRAEACALINRINGE